MSNDVVCVKEYACRCWARNATFDKGSDAAEYCGGRLIVSVIDVIVEESPMQEVRVKFVHS